MYYYRDKCDWSDAPKSSFTRIKFNDKPDMTIEVMQHHDGDWGYHIFIGLGMQAVYLTPIKWGYKKKEEAQDAGANHWITSIR